VTLLTMIAGSAFLLVVLIAWVVYGKEGRRVRQIYEELFDDQHLFRELPQTLSSLRCAAFAQRGAPLQRPTDPRKATTSKGLHVLYTVDESEDRRLLLNHISISYQGGPIAFALGGRCAYLLLAQLGIDPDSAAIAHSPRRVVHIAFLVRDEDAGDFYNRAPTVPLPESFPAVKAQASQWRDRVARSHRVLRDETQLLPALGAT
jgi:hypothetical protein